jgi:hypothetical protein
VKYRATGTVCEIHSSPKGRNTTIEREHMPAIVDKLNTQDFIALESTYGAHNYHPL